jgi:hypothetical protein
LNLYSTGLPTNLMEEKKQRKPQIRVLHKELALRSSYPNHESTLKLLHLQKPT